MLAVSYTSLTYADDPKITVVETRKIIESSTAHNDILKQVQKKNEQFRDEIQKSESELIPDKTFYNSSDGYTKTHHN